MEKSDAQRIDKNRFISILNTPFERAALIDDYSWDYSGYCISTKIRTVMTELISYRIHTYALRYLTKAWINILFTMFRYRHRMNNRIPKDNIERSILKRVQTNE